MFIIPRSPSDIMSEHRYHILISLLIEMMSFIAFVENVGHVVWWRRVDNCGRNYVGHVSMVFILRDT